MIKLVFNFCILSILLNSHYASSQRNAFIAHSASSPITIVYDSEDESTIKIAANALANDLKLLTGVLPVISNDPDLVRGDAIIIGTVKGSRIISRLEQKNHISVENVYDKWETFSIQSVRSPFKNIRRAVVIYGSDKRGAAYGVFHLSELLGISPWNWWADVIPEEKSRVNIPKIVYTSTTPSVKFRGIFLNDECWGLNPWASHTLEPGEGNIGPKTYAAIFELMLRLGANYIWPAMHPCTNAFYTNPENPKTAHNYGIFVGSSHAEPMLRNNVDEWDSKLMGDFNYFTNRQNVLDYWATRVRQSSEYNSIYTLGMRGIHDSGMLGAGSLQEQVNGLQEIIGEQRKMIKNYVNSDVSSVPQAFVPFKEVLDIYDAGLQLPDDVTIVYSNDTFGYLLRLPDTKQPSRVGGSGIYYHLSYWGRPHDYLWLCSTHPVLLWSEMSKAAHFGANQIWIVNVGDIKPHEYKLSLFLDMARNISNFPTGQSVRDHMKRWYSNVFGDKNGEIISDLMWSYNQLNFERRPEHMGWSQTEPTRKTHFTEYNHFEAGDEAQKRIDQFNYLKHEVVRIRETIPERLKDAFFQLVEYPVLSSGLLNKRILYMEKAYLYASQGRSIANDLALMSKAAYDSIVALTYYYNNTMADGKWRNMMYKSPRSLPVFQMPAIPHWEFNASKNWGVAVEGDESIRRISGIVGPLTLPHFNNLTKRKYFIDVFAKDNETVVWNAIPSSNWINLSVDSGTLEAKEGKRQMRIWVSVDWAKAPLGNRLRGSISFKCSNTEYTIEVIAIRPNISADFTGNSHFFMEDNGFISIHAENYNRVNNHASNREWAVLEGLGYTGRSVWVNPLIPLNKLTSILENGELSTIEYDFYTAGAEEITVTIFTLPFHPINRDFGKRFAISINDENPQIVDHRTFGRSDEWKLNVLRNSAIISTRHQLTNGGKQTLRIQAIDPGIALDRIVIDLGGKLSTYSVLEETKVKID